jgi:hypothetical protein
MPPATVDVIFRSILNPTTKDPNLDQIANYSRSEKLICMVASSESGTQAPVLASNATMQWVPCSLMQPQGTSTPSNAPDDMRGGRPTGWDIPTLIQVLAADSLHYHDMTKSW